MYVSMSFYSQHPSHDLYHFENPNMLYALVPWWVIELAVLGPTGT